MTEDELTAIEQRIAEVDRHERIERAGTPSGLDARRLLREAQQDRRLLRAELREARRRIGELEGGV